MFDKIFGYEKVVTNQVVSTPNYQNLIQPTEIENQVKNERNIVEVPEIFRIQILNALDKVDGEVNLATFSSFFKLYLASKGFSQNRPEAICTIVWDFKEQDMHSDFPGLLS